MTEREILLRLVSWWGWADEELHKISMSAAIHGVSATIPDGAETLDKIIADAETVLDSQETK